LTLQVIEIRLNELPPEAKYLAFYVNINAGVLPFSSGMPVSLPKSLQTNILNDTPLPPIPARSTARQRAKFSAAQPLPTSPKSATVFRWYVAPLHENFCSQPWMDR
jgi:hypothetical protein